MLTQKKTNMASCKMPLTEIPDPLSKKVFELKFTNSDFFEKKIYQSFCAEYADWPASDLLCRLRTLCAQPVGFELEICAVHDLLISKHT